jgi:hypothetical protein
MALHAFDDIDDAVDATKSLLLPFDLRRWFRFAIVTLLAGGATVASPFGTGGNAVSPSEPGMGGTVPERVLLLVAAVVLVALLIGLILGLLGSVMQFVLFDALRTKSLEVRAGTRRYLGKGVRLFGFRLALALVVVLPIAGLFALAFLSQSAAVFLLLLALFFVFVPLAIVLGLVNGFTTMFVVPIMLTEDRGVLAAWRRLWPALRSNLKEFGAYALMGFVLNLAVGFIAGIVAAIAAFLLLIPFGLVVGIPAFLLAGPGGLGLAGGAVIAVGALFYGLTLLLVVGYVQVPLQAFVRYYAALVLGDVEPELDPIEDVRREVRADGGADTTSEGPSDGRDTDSGSDDAGVDDTDEDREFGGR